MKLLYIATHQAWPLTTGARLRDYHLARCMASRCRVTFFEILVPSDDPSAKPPAEAGFHEVVSVDRHPGYTPALALRGIVGPLPLTILNYWSEHIAKRITEVLKANDFDLVQLESIHLFPYADVIRRATPRATLVHDYHNIESELMFRYSQSAPNLLKRLVAKRTAELLEATELKAERSCDAITVPSERERETILRRSPGAAVYTIPNGVDTAYFDECFSASGDTRRDLLFVGSMDYHANVDAVQWFVRDTWPLIAARFPHLRFVIVGRNPGAAVRALASERVIVTGTVDDVRPWYTGALAVMVPLRVGSGTRLKILEAMAAGVPVVSTRLGAEGIDVSDGENLLLAETPAEMAEATAKIAGSPDLRERLRQAARRLVSSRYDWSSLGDSLYSIHQSLSKRPVSAG